MNERMKTYLSIFGMLALTTVGAWAESFQGVVFPNKQVAVSSPVIQDIIMKMHVREGDVVKEGDILVELRREREELDVKLSEKTIELKKFIARGQQRLFKEEMGSEEKALEARTELELSQVMLEAKKIALREKTIVSPLSGTVVKKYKEAGESIAREEKLVDIVNLEKVNVRFYLKPELRPTLKKDSEVQVKVPQLNGASFPGKITFIDPRNDATSTFVQVWVEIDNHDHKIAPGMNGLAEF
jgi:membrane fusion protein, multidrug efflux system